MCNKCQPHNAKMMGTLDARKGFLTMLADASSKISEMDAGIIAKSIRDKVDVGVFGSIDDIICISSDMFLTNLRVALGKAEEEKDLELIAKLYNQLIDMAIQISGFVDELSTTKHEIEASTKEG